jgi:hypothetical protein
MTHFGGDPSIVLAGTHHIHQHWGWLASMQVPMPFNVWACFCGLFYCQQVAHSGIFYSCYSFTPLNNLSSCRCPDVLQDEAPVCLADWCLQPPAIMLYDNPMNGIRAWLCQQQNVVHVCKFVLDRATCFAAPSLRALTQ